MAKNPKKDALPEVPASVWMPFSLHVPSGAGDVAASEADTAPGLGVEEAWLQEAEIGGFSQELPPGQRTIPATPVNTRLTTVVRTSQPEPPGFCVDTRADLKPDFKADPPRTGDRPSTTGGR